MQPPLFVSDLDGTLLQSDGKLSPFAHQELKRLTDEGVAITVASGRTFSSIRRALGTASLSLPVISSDGALISRFDSPDPLHLFAMEEMILDNLIADLLARGHSPLLDLWDGHENFLLSIGPQNPIEAWYHDHKSTEAFYRFRHNVTLARPAGSQTISLTLLDRPEWLEPLREDLDEVYGDWFKTDYARLTEVEDGAALWIQHRDARKENALEILAQMLKVEAEAIVVFGDELNDLGMFGREWHAVAVGNAREELKQKAREVIGHHSEDSVLHSIRERVDGARANLRQ